LLCSLGVVWELAGKRCSLAIVGQAPTIKARPTRKEGRKEGRNVS